VCGEVSFSLLKGARMPAGAPVLPAQPAAPALQPALSSVPARLLGKGRF